MPKNEVHKIDKIDSVQQCWNLLAGGRNRVNFLTREAKGQGEGPGCSQDWTGTERGKSGCPATFDVKPFLGKTQPLCRVGKLSEVLYQGGQLIKTAAHMHLGAGLPEQGSRRELQICSSFRSFPISSAANLTQNCTTGIEMVLLFPLLKL